MKEALWLFARLKPFTIDLALIASLSVIAAGLGLAMPMFLQNMLDPMFTVSVQKALLYGFAVASAAIALKTIAEVAIGGLAARVVNYLEADLAVATFSTIVRRSVEAVKEEQSKQLYSAQSEITVLADFVKEFVIDGGLFAVRFAFSIAIFMVLLPQLAFALALYTLFVFVVSYVFDQRLHSSSQNSYQESDHLKRTTFEMLKNFRTVKQFAAETSARWQRESAFIKLTKGRRKFTFDLSLSFLMTQGASLALRVASILLILFSYLDGKTNLGQAMALVFLATQIVEPLFEFIQNIRRATQIRPVARVLMNILELPTESFPLASAAVEELVELSFEGVKYRFFEGESKRSALETANFAFKQGEITAIVGETGAGKSTVAKLLCGLIEPTEGKIVGTTPDARKISRRREHCALVPQSPMLFAASISENIAMFDPSVSAAAIRDACQAASVWEFIATLPDGSHEAVAADGRNFSGGQLQRVNLARAFNRSAPMLVLDEPTSALDPATAARFFTELQRIKAGRIIVMVTHDMNLAKSADRILVLNKGCVVEFDEPQRLMGQYGFFYKLWRKHEAAA